MHIALVAHTLDPAAGGIASATVEMGLALTQLGHTITLISFDAPSSAFLQDIPSDLKILAVGPAKGAWGYVGSLGRSLKGSRFDAMILGGLWLYSTFGMAAWARRHRVPYVIFPHGMLDAFFRSYPIKHFKKLVYWLLFEHLSVRYAKALCFTTTTEKVLSQHTFPWFAPQRQEVIGLGLRSSPTSPSLAQEAFYRAFPQLKNRPFLLYLSRFHPKKAPDLLLRALAEHPQMTLVMAGPLDEKDPYLHSLRQLCPPGQVEWTGLLTGELKWGALAAAQALVLPSHQENFGMVVAEALSVGTAVLISGQVALAPDVMADAAGLVAPDTLLGVRSLLSGFAELSAADMRQMRENARLCYQSRYLPSVVASRLVTLLQDCVSAQ